jgi:hypothetical protein
MPKPQPTTVQTSSQTNIIDAGGTASFDLTIGGERKGTVHHIDLGNTVVATQSNDSTQVAVGGGEGNAKSLQTASQLNLIDASGDATFRVVIEGDQKGAIHHIDIGNIVAALQSNTSVQFAVQAGGDSLVVQAAWQANLIDASGDATLVLTISGDHKGAIHHIGVGNTVTAVQTNDSFQFAAQGDGGGEVVQAATQTNLVGAAGDTTLVLATEGDHHGAIAHIDIGNTVVAAQTNDSVQVAVTGTDWQL